MKIAFVASEVFPYAKTGGLGDVSGSLPLEISKSGHDIKVFTPLYGRIRNAGYNLSPVPGIGTMPVRCNGKDYNTRVFSTTMPDSRVTIYFVDCPHYFSRAELYTKDGDEDERFILFSKSVIEALQRLGWAPDILHCNDWQTGLIPLLLKENYGWDKMFAGTATIFTIHNIAYQGVFPKESFTKAGIDEKHSNYGGVGEFYGKISFIKTGILTADIITTVSRTYAGELLTPEFGAGIDGCLYERRDNFTGILNGVDYKIWNPEIDNYIPCKYAVPSLENKIINKRGLLERLNLPFDEKRPLIGMVSRIVEQKGFDLIIEALERLMALNAQWIILGSGHKEYETIFSSLARKFPEKVSLYIGFNDELSHFIEAGADIFLMPSRFEPCGLNQIYSLKYGTVPVVRKTGGLADTVEDWDKVLLQGPETGTGFTFTEYNAGALVDAVERSIRAFHDPLVWRVIQINGMKKDYSWNISAEKYIRLYEKAVKMRTGVN
jgi:starch synthase